MQRLPVEPFLAAVRASHDELGRDVPRATRKAIERARAAGTVSELVADRLAVRLLGVHPGSIWPEWWEIEPTD